MSLSRLCYSCEMHAVGLPLTVSKETAEILKKSRVLCNFVRVWLDIRTIYGRYLRVTKLGVQSTQCYKKAKVKCYKT